MTSNQSLVGIGHSSVVFVYYLLPGSTRYTGRVQGGTGIQRFRVQGFSHVFVGAFFGGDDVATPATFIVKNGVKKRKF